MQQIFEANENAVKEMEQVFKEHESIETVVVDPNNGKRITFAKQKGWLTRNETFIPCLR
ncbi:hypothetical protein P7H22_26045 [Paenibacillus larvae]|nr:hypothetical protein [Paenibacillus larvae]MDT2243095.1 hypothetical protein [Paenibacillus larvae]